MKSIYSTDTSIIKIFTTSQVGLSPSKKIYVIFLFESPLQMMKKASYFVLKALSVLKIFKSLSRVFGHVGKTAWLER